MTTKTSFHKQNKIHKSKNKLISLLLKKEENLIITPHI